VFVSIQKLSSVNTVYYYGSVHGPNNFSYITASLSHKRFDYCSSILSLAVALCVVTVILMGYQILSDNFWGRYEILFTK
jgi:hypothetical protein